MSNVVPIRGVYESPQLLLQHIAEDTDIISMAVMVLRKDGFVGRAQFNMTRAQMAFFSVLTGKWALEEGEELEG